MTKNEIRKPSRLQVWKNMAELIAAAATIFGVMYGVLQRFPEALIPWAKSIKKELLFDVCVVTSVLTLTLGSRRFVVPACG